MSQRNATFYMKSGNKIFADKITGAFTVETRGNEVTSIRDWGQHEDCEHKLWLQTLDLSQIEAIVLEKD